MVNVDDFRYNNIIKNNPDLLKNLTFNDFKPIKHNDSIIEIRIPFYFEKVYLLLEHPEFYSLQKIAKHLTKKQLKDYINHKYMFETNTLGRCTAFMENKTIFILIKDFVINYETISTLSHELLHACYQLFEMNNVEFFEEEQICNLQDYLLSSSLFHIFNNSGDFLSTTNLIWKSSLITAGTLNKQKYGQQK